MLRHPVVSDSEAPRSVAHQAPLSVGFSRQGSWSGLPFPSPGDLPDLGIELEIKELSHIKRLNLPCVNEVMLFYFQFPSTLFLFCQRTRKQKCNLVMLNSHLSGLSGVQNSSLGISLVVPGLRLRPSNARGTDSILDKGHKIPHGIPKKFF